MRRRSELRPGDRISVASVAIPGTVVDVETDGDDVIVRYTIPGAASIFESRDHKDRVYAE